jgi:hypothetical protein
MHMPPLSDSVIPALVLNLTAIGAVDDDSMGIYVLLEHPPVESLDDN